MSDIRGGGSDGDGVPDEENRSSALVQDRVVVGAHTNISSSVPVELHTLLVRRPGRVSAAADFVDKALSVVGFGACGDGDQVTKDMGSDEKKYDSGTPCKEFLSARAAALKTLEAYFNGFIDDELIVHARFKIENQQVEARFRGPIDAESGVLRDPKFPPDKDGIRRLAILTKRGGDPISTGASPVGAKASLTLSDGGPLFLPDGIEPELIAEIRGHAKDPMKVLVVLHTGREIVVNRLTGSITTP